MILTIDIGNSNICFGVYEGKTPLFTARAKTAGKGNNKRFHFSPSFFLIPPDIFRGILWFLDFSGW